MFTVEWLAQFGEEYHHSMFPLLRDAPGLPALVEELVEGLHEIVIEVVESFVGNLGRTWCRGGFEFSEGASHLCLHDRGIECFVRFFSVGWRWRGFLVTRGNGLAVQPAELLGRFVSGLGVPGCAAVRFWSCPDR